MKSLRYILGLVVLVLVLGSAAPPVEVGRYGSRQDSSAEELSLYTKALTSLIVYADTLKARQLSTEALAIDSMHTPSIVLLSRIAPTPLHRWELCERALRSDSTNGDLREMAAEAAARAGRTERAIELYGTMADTTTNLEIIHRLAMIHMLSNNMERSLALLDTLDVRFGYSEATSKMRQHIYNVLGEPEKAEAEALRLYNESPYDAYNIADLASYYESAGRFEEALKYYDKAIAVDSGEVDFRLGRLRVLERLGRTNEMLMTWFDIVPFPQIELSQKLSLTKNFLKSDDFYRRNLPLLDAIISRLYKLYGSDGDVMRLYAQHKWRTKEPERVVEAFKRSLAESNPPKEDLLSEVIPMEAAFNRPDSVLIYARLGARHYPANILFHQAIYYTLSQKGDHTEAIDYARTLLKNPAVDRANHSTIWTTIGDIYNLMGDNRASDAAYRKAIKLDANNAMAMNNYAYNMAVEGRSLPKALKLAEAAIAIEPKNATYLDTLAWVHFKMGNLEEAKRVQQTALSFDGNQSGEIALHYGDILAAMGNMFLAHTYWRKALELGGVSAEEVEQRLKK